MLFDRFSVDDGCMTICGRAEEWMGLLVETKF